MTASSPFSPVLTEAQCGQGSGQSVGRQQFWQCVVHRGGCRDQANGSSAITVEPEVKKHR